MERNIEITKDTKLTDIIEKYPWITEEAARIDERFRILSSPVAQVLLKNATVSDISRKSGLEEADIIGKIKEMIASRGTR